MANTAVCYTSKYGASKKTAERIAREAGAELYDISTDNCPDLDAYDVLVLGCGLYMGKPNKIMKKFIDRNRNQLNHKNLIFYVHGLISENQYNKCVNDILDVEERNIFYLGGTLDRKQLSGITKVMMKQIAKENGLDPDHPDNLNSGQMEALLKRVKEHQS